MEFKKCARCGCFFVSDNDICCNCVSKDKLDISNLTNILNENTSFNSTYELSNASGISINNINRLMKLDDFKDYKIDL